MLKKGKTTANAGAHSVYFLFPYIFLFLTPPVHVINIKALLVLDYN